jgi:(E)-4-hydroxy-3-methylbut-2-enyl-diphosphate synthase
MVESALEFVRIARKHDYHDIVLSMKASNPKVMMQAYRLLVARMDEEGLDPYPLHLGVTEAGLGEDGRIKSAIGIGALLDDGLGDTVRVSLTEEPEAEVPVAMRLVEPYNLGLMAARAYPEVTERVDPYSYSRRLSGPVDIGGLIVGGGATVAIVDPPEEALLSAPGVSDPVRSDRVETQSIFSAFANVAAVDLSDGEASPSGEFDSSVTTSVSSLDLSALARLDTPVPWYDAVRAYRALAASAGERPIHLEVAVDGDALEVLLRTSTVLGSLLCDGLGDSVALTAPGPDDDHLRLLFNVLQAAGVRITKTEFVSCPSCGRTLFDLQSTTERIASRTSHLKGVKIAIMGCVVNGPGEMADSDFGYVGGSPGKVNLYVGKDVVEKAVPEESADERLVELIRRHGKWVEPPVSAS